ncbi:AlpA family transcriptional regulator [Acinetobacter sp. ACNIH3]|uniref:helix-turn-helix transcriptional regulator n=1 Tax=unclassified Acinetobacter TaxID=196816 RepID=UPI000CDE296E|nr:MULTISPECIES: AlpA family phage regulatory protein [unclassified Acinetobacter]POU13045.1 AlpA family transcriptional regulator [Acinetobacter sp. ACNIH3]POV72432.1 AlpA family transcriptional regulator [Acinetobacter sp. ACNIH4]
MTESTKKFFTLKELASYSERPEKKHIYKSGVNKGKVKTIKARPAKSGLIPVSEKTIWCWIRDGKFPKPICLSSSIRVWKVEEIYEWLLKKELGDHS